MPHRLPHQRRAQVALPLVGQLRVQLGQAPVVSSAGSELGQLQAPVLKGQLGQLELGQLQLKGQLRHQLGQQKGRPGFPEHHHQGLPTQGATKVEMDASLALSALLQQLMVVEVICLL
jgi:hypothetical protein